MSIDDTALAAATLKVRTTKPKENFMVVSFDGGDVRIVLPYREGAVLMSALSNAEMLNDKWRSDNGIRPFRRDAVEVTCMSAIEYENHKIAQLLGVTYDDVVEAQKTTPPP